MDKQNRQEYFENIYRDTFKQLSKFVFFKVANGTEAEDVVASVYTSFYQYVVLRNKRPENALAYLVKMANHELSRYYSNNQHHMSFDDEKLFLTETVPDDCDVEMECFNQMADDALWQAVQLLSPAEQQVVSAKFRFEMTFREIAQALEQNESTVKLRYYRSLKKLQKIAENPENSENSALNDFNRSSF